MNFVIMRNHVWKSFRYFFKYILTIAELCFDKVFMFFLNVISSVIISKYVWKAFRYISN